MDSATPTATAAATAVANGHATMKESSCMSLGVFIVWAAGYGRTEEEGGAKDAIYLFIATSIDSTQHKEGEKQEGSRRQRGLYLVPPEQDRDPWAD